MTGPGVPEGRPAGRARGPRRRTAVLAVLALGVVGLALGAASWGSATAQDALGAAVAVEVTGRAVAPGVTAGAVVVVAAGLALTLAGRWTAPAVGVLVAAGGALEVAAALASAGALERAARTAAREAAGVDVLVAGPAPGPLRWLAVVVGVLTVVVGVVVVVAGRGWVADRRHGAEAPGAPSGERGGPVRTGGGAAPGAPEAPPGGRSDDGPDDDPAVWDRLTRGEDPT